MPSAAGVETDFDLPSIDFEVARDVLRHAGIDERQVDELARLARRRLTTLRQRLATNPELQIPLWAAAPVNRGIRSVVLTGGWDTQNQADRDLISKLSGLPESDVDELPAALVAPPEPLITRADRVVRLIDPYYAMGRIISQLTSGDLVRFKEAVLEVIGQVDPALDLDPDERWMGPILGKSFAHSSALREGLVRTVALLAGHGSVPIDSGTTTANDWAVAITRDLLGEVVSDRSGSRWVSIAPLLSTLIEAAPDVVLQSVRDSLAGDSPPLAAIFEGESQSSFLRSSELPHLLWALEVAAWSPDYFGQAVERLAGLADIDPGGTSSNRPLGSLKAAFLPWLPQTAVDSDARLAVLTRLVEHHPSTGWDLLVALLPVGHDSIASSAKPRYRDWARGEGPGDYDPEVVVAIVDLAIDAAGADPLRWGEILDRLHDLPAVSRERAYDSLRTLLERPDLGDITRSDYYKTIRETLAHQQLYSDSRWTIPSDELPRLLDLTTLATPSFATAKHGWLFAEAEPTMVGESTDETYAQRRELRREARRDAVREIAAESGWPGIESTLRGSLTAWDVGVALHDAGIDAFRRELLSSAAAGDDKAVDAASGYFSLQFQAEGWDTYRLGIDELGNSDDEMALLLLFTREFPLPLNIAHEFGESVAGCYWKRFSPFGIGQLGDIASVMNPLLAAGRPYAAILTANVHSYRSDAELTQDVLDALMASLEQLGADGDAALDGQALDAREIRRAFVLLQHGVTDWHRVAGLEFMFVGALGVSWEPSSLHRLLSEDPALFVELVSRVYVADDESAGDAELPEERKRLIDASRRVLMSFRQIPGGAPDGRIDGSALLDWVSAAREALRGASRLDIGDFEIGQLLAACRPDDDGSWPPLVVRDLLEDLQSSAVERGLENGARNRRNEPERLLSGGGPEERELARVYGEAATRFALEWPSAASVLRSLADGFEREAKRSEDFLRQLDE